MNFESSLDFLEANPLLLCDLQIVSQFAACLFLLLTQAEQEFLFLMMFNLSIFPFRDYAFGVKCKNSA